jgi:hypothetical protein
MKKFIKIQLLVFGLILASSISLYAQPGFEDDVDDVPLDGGISLLIAAGAVYGAKKLRHTFTKVN